MKWAVLFGYVEQARKSYVRAIPAAEQCMQDAGHSTLTRKEASAKHAIVGAMRRPAARCVTRVYTGGRALTTQIISPTGADY